jgi:hypothetical protein
MCDSVRKFLNTHRTAARWLDDIIDVLISRRGTAHVKVIADDLVKSNKGRDKDTAEQIVTRQINDFCSNAADFDKDAAHDLFQRVEPATYRLRAYPERPTVIELVRIEFDDPCGIGFGSLPRKSARKAGSKRTMRKSYRNSSNGWPGIKSMLNTRGAKPLIQAMVWIRSATTNILS